MTLLFGEVGRQDHEPCICRGRDADPTDFVQSSFGHDLRNNAAIDDEAIRVAHPTPHPHHPGRELLHFEGVVRADLA